MDYATTAIGAAPPAPKPKAKAAAPKRSTIPALASAKKGHRRDTCRPPAIRPAGDAAYGFLKTRFLPHFAGQPLGNWQMEEQGFYHSFGLLCSYYGLSPVDTQSLPFPYGSAIALHEAHRLLREKHAQHVCIERQQANGHFALCATETYTMQNTLFYIPVLPLHQMLQGRRRRKEARLLLCIFAYLYRVARVPFYREEDSYLYWNYDMLSQWVTDDLQGWDEDYPAYCSQINTALHIGEVMQRRLYSNVPLERFGKWLSDFAPHDSFGGECSCLAKRFYALWQDCPKADIYSHADTHCLPDPEQYDDTDCVTMEKYIGFVATTKGWPYDQLEQAVNSDFGECSSMQQPVLRRCFDGQAQEKDSLDYECRLFPLINELCYLLNTYDDAT